MQCLFSLSIYFFSNTVCACWKMAQQATLQNSWKFVCKITLSRFYQKLCSKEKFQANRYWNIYKSRAVCLQQKYLFLSDLRASITSMPLASKKPFKVSAVRSGSKLPQNRETLSGRDVQMSTFNLFYIKSLFLQGGVGVRERENLNSEFGELICLMNFTAIFTSGNSGSLKSTFSLSKYTLTDTAGKIYFETAASPASVIFGEGSAINQYIFIRQHSKTPILLTWFLLWTTAIMF